MSEAGSVAAPKAKIDHVDLRTFVHATEDPDRVEKALLFAAGVWGDERAAAALRKKLKSTASEGHAGNPIRILEVVLSNQRAIRRFLEWALQGSIAQVLRLEMDRRLDEDLVFYLRFSKQEAYQGRLELAQGEDVVHVRIKVATFPKRRKTAQAFLADLLEATAA